MRIVLLESGGKGDPCHIVVESLATLSPAVMWKENILNSLGLAKEISKLCVKGTT